MQYVGDVVIYMIMCCALIGAVCSILDESSPTGQQFLEGIGSIGAIFLPVAGIMAAAPYITAFVTSVFTPMFDAVGADPSMAATTFIAVDMGGYQLAFDLARTKESWIMAMMTGYMAGATIVFSIPVALKMIDREDRPCLALGVMSGLLAIPFGVLVSSLIIAATSPEVRSIIATTGVADYRLQLSMLQIAHNLVPLAIICGLLALGLLLIPDRMIRGFIILGRLMDAALRLVFVCCVIEYFTGVFSKVLGGWGFEPIIADDKDINRALEISGYIGIMLCGAFPMVYLIRTKLAKPLGWIGKKVGLSADCTAGILAASANVLALFAMVRKLEPADKVRTIAFSVCCAFLFGDHLAFAANFQPTLILPIMGGKLAGGIIAVIFAQKIAVSRIPAGMK